jgi:hypothetical protein
MNLIDVFSRAMSVLRAQPVQLDARPAHEVIPEFGSTNEVPIVVDRQIRTKYQMGWINKIRNTNTIKEVTLHATGGGVSTTSLLRWIWEGERSAEYKKGIALFHFLVGRDGVIVSIIDPAYYVYHSTSGQHDKSTLAVECINPSKNNDSPWPQVQYDSFFSLLFNHLFTLYPSIDRICSHRYNMMKYSPQVSPKQCPGAGFEWSKLDEQLRTKGFSFKTDGQCRYDIKKV